MTGSGSLTGRLRHGARTAGGTLLRTRAVPSNPAATFLPNEPPGVTSMHASYGQVIRRAAVPTAAAAVAMVALSAALGGMKGLVGALLGVALVIIFFGISVVAVSRAARVSPQAMMITAIVTFLAKMLVLAVLVANFASTTVFNARLFGFTAIVCIVAWSIAQAVVSARMKVLYVEPDGER